MKKEYIISLLFLLCIGLGSLVGVFIPSFGEVLSNYTDYMLLTLMFLIFLGVPFENLFQSIKETKVLLIILVTNFIMIPIIGFLLSYSFFWYNELIMIGLFIYFMAPCTDWFLGFTKVAKGNVSLGSILLPINMIIQLLMYPVYLLVFMGEQVNVDLSDMFSTLLDWFLIPFILGVVLHFVLYKVLKENIFEKFECGLEEIVNVVLYAIVFSIFAVNVQTIMENLLYVPLLLVAVFLFFVIVYVAVDLISRYFNFSYENEALYSMTTSARNAPMMLGITMSVFVNEPLIYAALVIGMLIEFPHLTGLSGILLRKKNKKCVVCGENSSNLKKDTLSFSRFRGESTLNNLVKELKELREKDKLSKEVERVLKKYNI